MAAVGSHDFPGLDTLDDLSILAVTEPRTHGRRLEGKCVVLLDKDEGVRALPLKCCGRDGKDLRLLGDKASARAETAGPQLAVVVLHLGTDPNRPCLIVDLGAYPRNRSCSFHLDSAARPEGSPLSLADLCDVLLANVQHHPQTADIRNGELGHGTADHFPLDH